MTTFDPAQIRAQHLRLRDTLRAIDQALDSTTRGGAPPGLALCVLASDLAEHLERHFETEESDDSFGRLLADAPKLARAVARLHADHDSLRQGARSLASLCEAGRADPARWNEVRDHFTKFASKLDVHERTEDEIFHRAFNEDVGGHG